MQANNYTKAMPHLPINAPLKTLDSVVQQYLIIAKC